MLDKYCISKINDYPNCMVSWYLMAAYGYYYKDQPIISDGLFDSIAKRLLEDWDNIEHIHKHLITIEDLKAGSLLLTHDKYPLMCIGAYETLVIKELSNAHSQ